MIWRKIEEADLPIILDWRTEEKITKFMYTDIPYNLENQKNWLHKINQDKNGLYWLIEYKSQPIGYVSLTSINWQQKHAYWNFYIGEERYSMLAGLLGFYMYNFAFEKLGFKKLLGEVMDINEGVRTLHIKQGAREVGFFESHIFKRNQWHDIYLYEMTKEKWQSLNNKYKRYVAEVEI